MYICNSYNAVCDLSRPASSAQRARPPRLSRRTALSPSQIAIGSDHGGAAAGGGRGRRVTPRSRVIGAQVYRSLEQRGVRGGARAERRAGVQMPHDGYIELGGRQPEH